MPDPAWDVGSTRVHLGKEAGYLNQSNGIVALGHRAGYDSQGVYGVSVGYNAGYSNQGDYGVSVGYNAGYSNQGDGSVAIGWEAGLTTQGTYSVAIGTDAGKSNQGVNSIAIGYQGGYDTQGANSIAIGYQAGYDPQGEKSVAIGYQAGAQNQAGGAIAIGEQAGGFINSPATTGQGANAIAIGQLSGYQEQGANSIAIGKEAGNQIQEDYGIAIGFSAGHIGQKTNSIAIGNQAGDSYLGSGSIVIGYQAGLGDGNPQGENCVAIGYSSGNIGQQDNSIAIGNMAGNQNLQNGAIAIGYSSCDTQSSIGSVAIGWNSSVNAASGNSAGVAIGYNATIDGGTVPTVIGSSATMNYPGGGSSVVLGSQTYGGQNGEGFYINQVREDDNVGGTGGTEPQYIDQTTQVCWYKFGSSNEICRSYLQQTGIQLDYSTAEISTPSGYVTVVTSPVQFLVSPNLTGNIPQSSFSCKSFVIDHPKEPDTKHLVHVCLEGPEAGVYYRGKGEVTNNESVKIKLPDYVPGWAYDFTVNVTAIYDGKVKFYAVSDVDKNGIFSVYGENGKFNWTAIGKRADINVEPLKTETDVKGFGPYKWIN